MKLARVTLAYWDFFQFYFNLFFMYGTVTQMSLLRGAIITIISLCVRHCLVVKSSW